MTEMCPIDPEQQDDYSPSVLREKTVEELNEEIRALAVEIDFAHRRENGYDYSDEEFAATLEKQKELIRQRDNTFNGYCLYCGGEIRGESYHSGTACNECDGSGFATQFDESLAAFAKRQKTQNTINRIKRIFRR